MTYQVDSKVLTYHGPLLYEARILKIEEQNDKSMQYYVHYKGWKTSWDEWVQSSRILPWTEENLQKQKELKEAAFASQRAQTAAAHEKKEKHRTSAHDVDAKSTASTATGSSGIGRGHKRARETPSAENEKSVPNEDETSRRSELRFTIPDSIKSLLVDDWENITKNQQLVPLPRSPNVQQVFEQFEAYQLQKSSMISQREVSKELIKGLIQYFDKMLGQNLLYRFERQQLLETVKAKSNANKCMSEIYGPEHLLRLIVILPELVAQANIDYPSVQILRQLVDDFLQWASRHQSEIFQAEYINASPNYQSLARGT